MRVLRAVGSLLRLVVMSALVALVILVGLLYFDMTGQVSSDVRRAAASALGPEVVQTVERKGETAVSALDRLAQPVLRLAESALSVISGPETKTEAETAARTPNAWAAAESRAVMAEINAYRRENGLKPLTWDDNLAAFGQQRADDMVARDYFSHNDPRTGKVLLTELRRLVTVGENLYQVSGPAVQFMRQVSSSTVRGWKNSPSHNELMLMDSMRYGGVAISRTPTRIVAVLIVSG